MFEELSEANPLISGLNTRGVLPGKFGWGMRPARAFVDGVIDNDKKVAFSKKTYRIKKRVEKPHHLGPHIPI